MVKINMECKNYPAATPDSFGGARCICEKCVSKSRSKIRVQQMTNLLRSIKAKGWTAKEVGERWGIKPRQMSNISQNPKVKDFDAVEGLPTKCSKTLK